jgi:hypothetical protein
VLLVAEERRHVPGEIPQDQGSPPHPALAEFDAAMAEIDRLLSSNSGQL